MADSTTPVERDPAPQGQTHPEQATRTTIVIEWIAKIKGVDEHEPLDVER